MRQIIAIAWKDTRLRFSSRSELLFFIILPVVFTLILSGGLAKMGQNDDRVPVLVVDQDHSPLSAELLQTLGQSSGIRTVTIAADQAEAEFAKNSAPAWLTVPAGFGAALTAGRPITLDLRALPNNLNALAAERAINLATGQVGRALTAANASTIEAERRLRTSPHRVGWIEAPSIHCFIGIASARHIDIDTRAHRLSHDMLDQASDVLHCRLAKYRVALKHDRAARRRSRQIPAQGVRVQDFLFDLDRALILIGQNIKIGQSLA